MEEVERARCITLRQLSGTEIFIRTLVQTSTYRDLYDEARRALDIPLRRTLWLLVQSSRYRFEHIVPYTVVLAVGFSARSHRYENQRFLKVCCQSVVPGDFSTCV